MLLKIELWLEGWGTLGGQELVKESGWGAVRCGVWLIEVLCVILRAIRNLSVNLAVELSLLF